MKVLFLIESMDVESGGPAIEISNLTRLLVRTEGLNLTIATTTPRHKSLPIANGIEFYQFVNPSFPRLSWFKAISQLKNLICDHDIIFSTGIWGPIDGFALRLAWQKNKPVFIRVCGMLEPYILGKNSLKKKVGMTLYLRKNLHFAKGIIVNSQSEALNVKKLNISQEKILIIPNGVDVAKACLNKREAKQKLGIKEKNLVLLYLGRLHPKKGFHFLLEAIAALPSKNQAFTLLVAGEFHDNNYRCFVEKMIADFNLNDMIKFTGLVSGEVKERHFCAADCFILPSQSEGLPNAVLEAMAHELPVIITSGCNIPEVADYKAGLVVELSIKEMIEALKWFLFERQSVREAALNAKRFIMERFNPEETTEMYKRIILENVPPNQNSLEREVFLESKKINIHLDKHYD